MGEQRNLTEENVEALKEKLDAMQKDNPGLEHRFFDQDKEPDDQPSNKAIFEKLEAIERQIKMIFDGHVLIDGRFTKITIKRR